MNRIIVYILLFFSLSGFAQVTPATNPETPPATPAATNESGTDLETLYTLVSEIDTALIDVPERTELLELYVLRLHEGLQQLAHRSDSIDNSLGVKIVEAKALSKSNHNDATEKIQVVENSSQTNFNKLAMWGLWSIVGLLLVAIVVYILLHMGINKSKNAIATIRQAQESLQEESVKLDAKLLDVLERQIEVDRNNKEANHPSQEMDHSLALKVADEITRIELNLSRMDSSIKGYKQLSKAVDRIKNNFEANGYEIVTYVGQPYNEGMRINAEFVIDEELPQGTRTITSVSKPQVHHNGELIQKATVTVSQNI